MDKKDKEEGKMSTVERIMAGVFWGGMGIGIIFTNPVLFLIALLCLLIAFFSVIMNAFVKVKLKLQRLTPADFGIYKEYYRDIIEEHSPLVLSYIDNFNITKKDVIGTLLKLQVKKYIELKNMKSMKVLKNNDYELKSTEQYVIENEIQKIDYDELKKVTEEEALSQGLLEHRKLDKDKIKHKIISSILIFILSIVVFFIYIIISAEAMANDVEVPIFITSIVTYIVLIGTSYPFYRVMYFILYMRHMKREPYIRSKKGNEINEKLEGLKKYIKDYSMLDKRNYEELTLWEEYLIYSVMFGQNRKVLEDILDR